MQLKLGERKTMRQKKFYLVISGVLLALIVGAVALISLTELNTPEQPPVHLANSNPKTLGTTLATGTPSPTIATATTTSVAPSIPPGQVISLPSSERGDLTLVSTNLPPTISQETAMRAVYNLGLTFALGGQVVNGKSVTLQATFGLATFGKLANDGKNWEGNVNIPIQTCTSDGKCRTTGQILDHIENRPMWILDYGNTIWPGSARPSDTCGKSPCPTPVTYNHSVYAVDAITGVPMFAWPYSGS